MDGGFLRRAVESATAENWAPGRLLVYVAPLVDDAEVRQFLYDAVAAAWRSWSAGSATGSARETYRPTFPCPCARARFSTSRAA